MDMTYSADIEHIDEPLHAAADELKAGEPIRVRIQPMLWRKTMAQHRSWAGVSWTVNCRTVDEAIALREALRAFFEAIARVSPGQVQGALELISPLEKSA